MYTTHKSNACMSEESVSKTELILDYGPLLHAVEISQLSHATLKLKPALNFALTSHFISMLTLCSLSCCLANIILSKTRCMSCSGPHCWFVTSHETYCLCIISSGNCDHYRILLFLWRLCQAGNYTNDEVHWILRSLPNIRWIHL